MQTSRAAKEYRKLGDLDGSSSQDKIEVWTRAAEDGSTHLELVEYSWGSGIGWYVQKRMRLDPGQVEALKALLAQTPAEPPRPRRTLPPIVRHGSVIQLVFPASE
jgi:hypothetical protein